MLKDLQKESPSSILLLLLLALGSFYFFENYMDVYPSYIHAWTQSDRLAIAMNFQENGFDFFHPATFNLLTKGGITQVDFPIHDYLVAGISSILKTDIVQTFRWYNLVYALIGWIFLFRFGLKMGLSSIRSLFLTVFFFTLPFLLFYQNGFIPSIPSLANFIIGLYFVAKYFKESKKSSLIISLIFLTLAGLSRAPFTIFLIAYSMVLAKKHFMDKSIAISPFVLSIVSISFVVAYWMYNQYLSSTYGSMFLDKSVHFDSFSNFIEIISKAIENWGTEILSPYHLIILILFIGLYVGQRRKSVFNTKKSDFDFILLFSLLGVLFYFFLLGNQFADHDYYYIDTFIPLLILGLGLLLKRLRLGSKLYPFVGFLCILFSFYFFSFSRGILNERYTPPYNDRVEYAYSTYKNSVVDFKEWGITKEDTLVVLDISSTNIPFTVWGNKGYTSLGSAVSTVDSALKQPHDYVIMIDSFFRSDGYQDYPALIGRLELLNTNGEISQYKLTENSSSEKFFKNLIFDGATDFDNNITLDSSSMAWVETTEDSLAYGKSMKLKPDQLFMLTTKVKVEHLIKDKDVEVSLLADFKPIDSLAKIQFVVSTDNYYRSEFFENQVTKVNQWQNQLYRIIIPYERIIEGETISVYFWNPEKNDILIDNYRLLIMQ